MLNSEKNQRTLEITLPILRIRLSYYDVRLMLYMFESISKQIDQARATLGDNLPKRHTTMIVSSPPPLFESSFITGYCSEIDQNEFSIRSTTSSPLS